MFCEVLVSEWRAKQSFDCSGFSALPFTVTKLAPCLLHYLETIKVAKTPSNHSLYIPSNPLFCCADYGLIFREFELVSVQDVRDSKVHYGWTGKKDKFEKVLKAVAVK